MSELDDVRLDRPGSGSQGAPPKRGPSGWGWILLVLLLVVIAVGVWYYLRGRSKAPEVAPPVPEAPVAEVAPAEEAAPEPQEEPIELPPLDASDAVVRRLVSGLSSNPTLASWLATDHLVGRFVVVVDNLAVGLLPRKQVPLLAPKGEFRVAESTAGPPHADPSSYHRYDTVAAVVASLDPEGTVELYRRLRPLIDQASRERLGYDADRFDETLRRAILHLLETPVPSGPPALEPRVRSYHYADPRLEDLSDAQKQLLRMGPQNERAVQAKLRQLARRLGVPADQIPAERTLGAA